jgi:hypothetical protein
LPWSRYWRWGSRDVEALRSRRTSSLHATRRRTRIEKELGRGIESVRVEPLSEGFALEYTLDGVTYRPNLAPVRRLRIEFTQSEER